VSKSIFPLRSAPPLGEIPESMYAAVIRPERYGPPETAFKIEEVAVPRIGSEQVLVYVMAAGVNYNNVWAALGKPVDIIAARRKRGETDDFHIGGSEASGIVWAIGSNVRGLKPGQPVIVSGCRWDERAEDIRMGADPMTSVTTRVWGYEDNFGAFSQFTVVDEYQCHAKPANMSWEDSASLLCAATAYRMLRGWPPHVVEPNDPVLVWGGAGGVGSMAIQLARHFGARPVAVVSDESKAEFCLGLGAQGVIDRSEFTHWGRLPQDGTADHKQWLSEVRRFGAAFWEKLGERRNPRLIVEHPGQATIPTSIFLCDNAGMVVICGGTSGYSGDVDLRYLWMRQKRFQGSHFANRQQVAAVIHLARMGYLDPCVSVTAPISEIGALHQRILENKHASGSLVVLVNAPQAGLTSLDRNQ
jgi:crotonyl-CoA carboxylase/reductase